MILTDWIRGASASLEKAGIESPKKEPYLWLTLLTGKNRAFFIAHGSDKMSGILTDDDCARLEDIRLRRVMREPLAYILGRADFRGRPFLVGRGVLIPRPDSELVVEAALAVLGYTEIPWNQCLSETGTDNGLFGRRTDGVFRFMDLCTGSGCLGITTALELLEKGVAVSGILTDISPDALKYAGSNIEANGAADILTLCRCDLFPETAVEESVWNGERAEMIIANPPYITARDMEELMPEVREHEPRLALEGGDDGLGFYRRILTGADSHLMPGGWIVFEHGYDQGESVPNLCREAGYVRVMCFRDYGGQPRVTVARLPDMK